MARVVRLGELTRFAELTRLVSLFLTIDKENIYEAGQLGKANQLHLAAGKLVPRPLRVKYQLLSSAETFLYSKVCLILVGWSIGIKK